MIFWLLSSQEYDLENTCFSLQLNSQIQLLFTTIQAQIQEYDLVKFSLSTPSDQPSPSLHSLSSPLSLSHLSFNRLWYLSSSLSPGCMENHIPNPENLISQTEALGSEDPSPQLEAIPNDHIPLAK